MAEPACPDHADGSRLWCDECHGRARARLAEVEAERDTFKRAYSRASENGYTHAVARSAAEARLAEVEAELRHAREFGVIASRTAGQEAARAEAAQAEAREYRSAITWHTTCLSCSKVLDSAYAQTARAEAAETRLAAVMALCDEGESDYWVPKAEVRAAARGEGDQ